MKWTVNWTRKSSYFSTIPHLDEARRRRRQKTYLKIHKSEKAISIKRNIGLSFLRVHIAPSFSHSHSESYKLYNTWIVLIFGQTILRRYFVGICIFDCVRCTRARICAHTIQWMKNATEDNLIHNKSINKFSLSKSTCKNTKNLWTRSHSLNQGLWIWLNFPMGFHLEVNTMKWRKRERGGEQQQQSEDAFDVQTVRYTNGIHIWICRSAAEASRKKIIFFLFPFSELSVH